MSEVSTSESTEKEFKRIHLGAQQKPITLSDLQSTSKDDPAFTKFRQLLADFLTDLYQDQNLPLPQARRGITLKPDHSVCLYNLFI